MRTHGENDENTRTERPGRRRLLLPALAVVAVLGVGGGAWALSQGDDDTSQGAGASTPAGPATLAPPVDPATSADPGPGTAGSAEPIPPAGGNAAGPDTSTTTSPVQPPGAAHTYYPGQQNTPFSRYAVGADGRTLTTWFWGGACETNRVLFVSEAASKVSIRIETVPKGDMCIDIAIEHRLDVTIPTPLGERALVDAKTGATIIPGGNPFPAGG